MSNLAIITPQSIEEVYETNFDGLIEYLAQMITSEVNDYTLDEIEEAFTEALKYFKEKNIGA